MRLAMIGLALLAFVLPLDMHAGEKDKGDKKDVREIKLKGTKKGFPRNPVDKPAVITSDKELNEAFKEDADEAARLKKEVDFGKERLVYFFWSGSGGDRLNYKVDQDKKETAVLFLYTPGLTRDLRAHYHLYAIPKDATWRLQKGKPGQ
jgi:hypothetical protein